eukprot:9327992-Ditylum_brightwellii.AAC.1
MAPENEEPQDEGEWQKFAQTQSGQSVRTTAQYSDLAVMAFTEAEFGYQANLHNMPMLELVAEDCSVDVEATGVGSGLEGGFQRTHELKPMKYDEAMAVDK